MTLETHFKCSLSHISDVGKVRWIDLSFGMHQLAKQPFSSTGMYTRMMNTIMANKKLLGSPAAECHSLAGVLKRRRPFNELNFNSAPTD
jgi:hypothetical protein